MHVHYGIVLLGLAYEEIKGCMCSVVYITLEFVYKESANINLPSAVTTPGSELHLTSAYTLTFTAGLYLSNVLIMI